MAGHFEIKSAIPLIYEMITSGLNNQILVSITLSNIQPGSGPACH